MDAYTARCLQLSTNFGMPPQQQGYRQNRFENMNRSRFPVNSQQQQPRRMAQRSNSMPATSWRMPQQNAVRNPAFKQSFTPQMGGQAGFSPATTYSPQDISPSRSSNMDAASFYSPLNTSPETPFGNDGWDPSFTFDPSKPMKQNEGLGMNFDFDPSLEANPFDSQNEFQDLVHINGNETVDLGKNNPGSPDRRSESSSSSNEHVSDFPDFDGNVMNNMSAADVPMATVEEDSVPDFPQQIRHGRSHSRAPAPTRASSCRSYRRAPYSFTGHRRSSSVMSAASTMSVPMSLPATQCCSPVQEYVDDLGVPNFDVGLNFVADPSMLTEDLFMQPQIHFDHSFQEPLVAPKPMYAVDNMFLSSLEDPLFEKAPIVPSSNIHAGHAHPHGAPCDDFADYAEEPDLFGPLSEEQSVPSEEDMNPEDKDMTPQEQDLRFEGDLYTPRFVRGQGNKREGYCGLCKPGRWLVLKNSAFWYDKSFTHGISAATGLPFDGPKETRRMSGNPDVWEGLCGCCNEWIALISNKKKGTTWFRHAYKCHNAHKNKDAPKKRRDSTAGKSSRSSSVSRPAKTEENTAPKLESVSEDVKSEAQPVQGNNKALQSIGFSF